MESVLSPKLASHFNGPNANERPNNHFCRAPREGPVWEASGSYQEASGRHLGGIWIISGRHVREKRRGGRGKGAPHAPKPSPGTLTEEMAWPKAPRSISSVNSHGASPGPSRPGPAGPWPGLGLSHTGRGAGGQERDGPEDRNARDLG